jgi:Glu-tRNA(Gln) amidotransferase subunit E-like FAD-binding protein
MTPNTPSHNEERTGCEVCENCVNGKVCKDIISSSKDEKVEKIVEEFDDRAQYYIIPHEIISDMRDFLRQSLQSYRHSIESEVRGSTIESVRAMVINELRQQRMEGFSLDGTDFNAVFDSVKKTITTPVKPLQD